MRALILLVKRTYPGEYHVPGEVYATATLTQCPVDLLRDYRKWPEPLPIFKEELAWDEVDVWLQGVLKDSCGFAKGNFPDSIDNVYVCTLPLDVETVQRMPQPKPPHLHVV